MRKLMVIALLAGLSITLAACNVRNTVKDNNDSVYSITATEESKTKSDVSDVSTTKTVSQKNAGGNEKDEVEQVLSEADNLLSGLDDVQASDVSIPNS